MEINLRTHKQTLVTQQGSLLEPLAIQPGPGDTIYLADSLAETTGAIFQVNCQTGQQTLIATGGYLNQPVDMALDPQGDLIVVDGAGGGLAGLGNVVSINPKTGGQTLVSSGGLLASTNGISVSPTGEIFVSTFAPRVPMSRPASSRSILLPGPRAPSRRAFPSTSPPAK